VGSAAAGQGALPGHGRVGSDTGRGGGEGGDLRTGAGEEGEVDVARQAVSSEYFARLTRPSIFIKTPITAT
jgi:hypothetical protein